MWKLNKLHLQSLPVRYSNVEQRRLPTIQFEDRSVEKRIWPNMNHSARWKLMCFALSSRTRIQSLCWDFPKGCWILALIDDDIPKATCRNVSKKDILWDHSRHWGVEITKRDDFQWWKLTEMWSEVLTQNQSRQFPKMWLRSSKPEI
jgi:hypothetical protein